MENSWILGTNLLTFFIIIGFLVYITYKLIKDSNEIKTMIQKLNTTQTGHTIAMGAIADVTKATPIIMKRISNLLENNEEEMEEMEEIEQRE